MWTISLLRKGGGGESQRKGRAGRRAGSGPEAAFKIQRVKRSGNPDMRSPREARHARAVTRYARAVEGTTTHRMLRLFTKLF